MPRQCGETFAQLPFQPADVPHEETLYMLETYADFAFDLWESPYPASQLGCLDADTTVERNHDLFLHWSFPVKELASDGFSLDLVSPSREDQNQIFAFHSIPVDSAPLLNAQGQEKPKLAEFGQITLLTQLYNQLFAHETSTAVNTLTYAVEKPLHLQGISISTDQSAPHIREPTMSTDPVINDTQTFFVQTQADLAHNHSSVMIPLEENASIVRLRNLRYLLYTYNPQQTLSGTILSQPNLDVAVFFDSGATHSIITQRTYKRLSPVIRKANFKPLPKQASFNTGNGPIPAIGTVTLALLIGPAKFVLTLTILPTQCWADVILGRSFFEQMDAIQLYGNRYMCFKIHTVPFCALKHTHIPPHKTQRVTFELHTTARTSAEEIQGEYLDGDTIAYFTSYAEIPRPTIVPLYRQRFTLIIENERETPLTFPTTTMAGVIDIRSKGYMPKVCINTDCLQLPMPQVEPAANMHVTRISDPPNMLNKEEVQHIFAGRLSPQNKITTLENSKVPVVYPTVPEIDVVVPKVQMQRHFPWLDDDDPRLLMTDEECLRLKLSFEDSLATLDEQENFIKMFLRHRKAVSLRDEIGTVPHVRVHLAINDPKYFFVRPYNVKLEMRPIFDREMRRGELLDIWERGHTAYCSPCRLIERKHKNMWRVISDFRYLNSKLASVQLAFPLIRDVLAKIGSSGATLFTVVDLRDAYHSLLLAEDSRQLCGITPYFGSYTYVYKRMGMGLNEAPAIWQQFITQEMEAMPNRDRYVVIMDDILIASTPETHAQDMENLLIFCKKIGIKLSPHKVQLMKNKIVFFGMVFFVQDGKPCYTAMKDMCSAIRNLKQPQTVTDVRKFCGKVQFLSAFLPKLAELLIPLYEQTKKRKYVEWTSECEENFQQIKQLLQKPPVLRMPASEGHFTLESDTSLYAAGGALYQKQNDLPQILAQIKNTQQRKRVSALGVLVGYHSKKLPETASRYSITELELLGMVVNITGFKQLLCLRPFDIIIDHKAIEFIVKAQTEPATARISKLLHQLRQYKFTVKYQKGSEMFVSDALSRLQFQEITPLDDVIPLNFLPHVFFYFEKPQQAWHTQMAADLGYQSPTHYSWFDFLPLAKRLPRVPAHNQPPITQWLGKDKTQEDPQPPSTEIEQQVPDDSDAIQATPPTDQSVLDKAPLPQTSTPADKPVKDMPLPVDILSRTQDPTLTRYLPPPQTLITKPVEQLLQPKQALITAADKLTVLTRHIPHQQALTKLMGNIRKKFRSDWEVPLTVRDLVQAYKRSPRFGATYNYLATNTLPSNPQARRKIDVDSAHFFLVNGLLFKSVLSTKLHTELFSDALLVIPEEYEPIIFNLYHSSVMSSHVGYKRTAQTLEQTFYIVNMRAKLANYIKACSACQLAKRDPGKRPPGQAIPRIPLSYVPLSRLSADIKFMPVSATGYKFILVCVCEFTNFVILISLRDRNALTLAAALYDRVISIFGIPQFLNIDEDSALTGKVISILLRVLKIDVRTVSPYNHGSLRAERYIRTCQDLLVKQLTGMGTNWPDYVPSIMWAMNTYATETLEGLSPFEMVFVRPPTNFLSLNIQELEDTDKNKPQDFIAQLRKKRDFMIDTISKLKTHHAMIRAADKNKYQDPPKYNTGDLISLLSPRTSDLITNSRKFIHHYIGPLVVDAVLADNLVTLRTIHNQSIPGVYHVNRLRKWDEYHPKGNITTQAQLVKRVLHNESNPVRPVLDADARTGLHPQGERFPTTE